MATLNELKKRLRSIKTTGQLAGAMKTVSTAKYSKLSALLEQYRPYSREALKMLSAVGVSCERDGEHSAKRLIVVISGNRGLCGGYNSEVLAKFRAEYEAAGADVCCAAAGRVAREHCESSGIPFEFFDIPDVPSYSDIKPLAEYIRHEYFVGEVGSVTLVYQQFVNMLTQTPVSKRILPLESAAASENEEVLFVPDRETVSRGLTVQCIDALLYETVLEAASGAQAATLMAMRSAYDNASESELALVKNINSRRQTEVTASVIETASGFSDVEE